MSLKTNYKSDVLGSGVTARHYKVMNGSTVVHADVTLSDITTYSTKGDTFGATDLNAITTQINNLATVISVSVTATATSATISNSRITTSSVVRPYFEVAAGTATAAKSYKTIKVETGKVTLTFDAFGVDTKVGVIVWTP